MYRSFHTPPSLPSQQVNTAPFLAELQELGLPAIDVQTSSAYPGQLIVVCDCEPTEEQSTQMDAAISSCDLRPRAPRSLLQIYTDLVALTSSQQSAIWTNFSAGSPPKYLLDTGNNAAALIVLDWVVRSSGAKGAALTSARFRAVAMYVQDNANYLVAPAFDPTINVPGDVPVEV